MDKLELYKSFYDRENQRRDTLNNSVSIPIGILSGLIAAVVFLTTRFVYNENLICLWIFLTLTALSILLIVISIIYLIKSFNNFVHGYNYMEIALLTDINSYYIELQDFNKKNAEKTELEFQQYLVNEFIKYADNNAVINDKRSYSLYKSKQFLFFSIVFIALTCIPFGFGVYKVPGNDTKVPTENIIDDSNIDFKIDSIVNVKLKNLENEREKSTQENTSPSAKTTNGEISKR